MGWTPQLLEKYRPIVAEHIKTGAGSQVQAVALQSLGSGALLFGPVYVGQTFGHRRSQQTGPVGHVSSIVTASNDYPGQRVLHAAAQSGFGLGKEAWILTQDGRQHECPEKLAGGVARHRSPEAFAESLGAVSVAAGRIFSLPDSRPEGRSDKGTRRRAIVHKQLEFLTYRKGPLGRSNVGKDNRPSPNRRHKAHRRLPSCVASS